MKMDTNSAEFRAAELAALLARHYPAATPDRVAFAVLAMQRAARAAKRFAEDRCNYDLGEAREARRQRREDAAEAAVNAWLASRYLSPASAADEAHESPARLALGGDPRGACGRLHIPGQRGDGWGDGFAVY